MPDLRRDHSNDLHPRVFGETWDFGIPLFLQLFRNEKGEAD